MKANEQGYGVGSNSYQAAGELAGITRLVDAFYDNMERLPEAARIRAMHPQDLSESRKKLTYFLSGWLGGPRLYRQNYGAITIPGFHRHLEIGVAERDAWLLCMEQAIAAQPYAAPFAEYLLAQLTIPADRVVQACAGGEP
ncbi:MAG: group II truncated hemoglobin [Gammaproteobacteria bacterium]|nr:group II truncated hemoglobin [Gammaproteobacteria bacterium]